MFKLCSWKWIHWCEGNIPLPVSFSIRTIQYSGRCCNNIRLWKIIVVKMNNRITIFEFDRCHFEGHPPPSTLVIHIFGFAIIEIVQFSLREVKQGNIAVKMALFRFFIGTTIWLKISHDDWSWLLISMNSSMFFYIYGWPYQSKWEIQKASWKP